MREERVIEDLGELEGGYFDDLISLAKIFNHDIVEITNSSPEAAKSRFGEKHLRWKKTKLGELLTETGIGVRDPNDHLNSYNLKAIVDLNSFWIARSEQNIPMEEVMKFYMQMGYSLSGFCDVFSNPAWDYKLPGALPYRSDEDYPQSVIDWMNLTYEGKVLKNI